MEDRKDFEKMFEETIKNMETESFQFFALIALAILDPQIADRIKEKAYKK